MCSYYKAPTTIGEAVDHARSYYQAADAGADPDREFGLYVGLWAPNELDHDELRAALDERLESGDLFPRDGLTWDERFE